MKLGMPTLLELEDIEAQAAFCHELGLAFVEINLNIPCYSPEHLSPEHLCQLKEQYKIEFTVHLPEELDLGSFHEPIRLATVDYIVSVMRWAQACDISVITMHLTKGIYFSLPQGKKYINVQYYSEYIEKLRQSMGQLYNFAESLGINLCIENTNNFDLSHVADSLTILSNFNGFNLTWDVGHDAKSGFVESLTINQFERNIKHMHLHDFNGSEDHQALMTGVIDINHYLSIAQANHLKVVIEVKDKESLCLSVKNLKGITAQNQWY